MVLRDSECNSLCLRGPKWTSLKRHLSWLVFHQWARREAFNIIDSSSLFFLSIFIFYPRCTQPPLSTGSFYQRSSIISSHHPNPVTTPSLRALIILTLFGVGWKELLSDFNLNKSYICSVQQRAACVNSTQVSSSFSHFYSYIMDYGVRWSSKHPLNL